MYGSAKSYSIGFLLSIVLTVEAFLLVHSHAFSKSAVMIIVLALAIVQLLVQLFFFLHFDRARRASWNILVFLFMGLVISIVIFGSLWIMKNLSYHMMTPTQTDQYMKRNEGL